jgi:hypothetical protein
MGRQQHDACVDVGQPLSPKPHTCMPTTSLRAEEQQRTIILLRSSENWLRGQCKASC